MDIEAPDSGAPRQRALIGALLARLRPRVEESLAASLRTHPHLRQSLAIARINAYVGRMGSGEIGGGRLGFALELFRAALGCLRPVSRREIHERARASADETSMRVLAMWHSVLAYAAIENGGYLPPSILDDAMFPATMEPDAADGLVVPGLDRRAVMAILRAVRAKLPHGQVLPSEMIELLGMQGIKIKKRPPDLDAHDPFEDPPQGKGPRGKN